MTEFTNPTVNDNEESWNHAENRQDQIPSTAEMMDFNFDDWNRSGDGDLYSLPSDGKESDILSPHANPQPPVQEHSHVTPADTLNPQLLQQQHAQDTPLDEWDWQAQLQQQSSDTPTKDSTSQPQGQQRYSPRVAMPWTQTQPPQYNQQSMYTQPIYAQEASFSQASGKYRNQALNLLSPSSTLSIIDRLFYTFNQELEWALEQEYERQKRHFNRHYNSGLLAGLQAQGGQFMNQAQNFGPLSQPPMQAQEGQFTNQSQNFGLLSQASVQAQGDQFMNQAQNFGLLPQPPMQAQEGQFANQPQNLGLLSQPPMQAQRGQYTNQEFQELVTLSQQPVSQMPYRLANRRLPPPLPDAFLSAAPQQAPINPVPASTSLHHEEPNEPEESEESEAESEEGKKPPGNKRKQNIKDFDASKYYLPLPTTPASWGSLNKKGVPSFTYTKDGELNPLLTFTTDQIIEYISQRPPGRDLKLWVQTVPADSGKRYPNQASDKCRFAECPDRRRTIRKGDFRVCFDEQVSRGEIHDPFHSAGYVHLFCLEKFLDFPDLCKKCDVQPDVRELLEGKNRMAITRDHASMEGIVKSFITNSLPWKLFENGFRPADSKDYYPHTLNYQLTVEHLDKQPDHLQRIREMRGGVTIDVHKNNLDDYVERKAKHREDKKTNAGPSKSKKGKGKRRRDESSEEEEDESGDDILDPNILQRRIHSGGQRPSKRQKKVDPNFRY